MKVVVDTNVFISGVFFGGVPGEIVAAWRSGRIEVAITPLILAEYRRIAAGLAPPGREQLASEVIDEMLDRCLIVIDPPTTLSLCRDPDDDKFLACASAVDAILVSGDKDLLVANGALGVTVLTPRAFLTRLDQRT